MAELNGYDLSRNWFDWCFENPELIAPGHSALYFFIIEHNNRLGWKEKFGLPTQMSMDAIGVRNWRTYKKVFDDLESWGFIKVLEKSKNQYSSTIIALVKNTKANTKALTKATQKHVQKQVISTDKSIAVIDKPNNQEPNNNVTKKMILSFKKCFPEYFSLDETDFPATYKIAKHIAEQKGWPESSITNGKMDDIIYEWETILEFTKSHSLYSNFSIQDLEKKWTGVIQSKNATKVKAESTKRKSMNEII